jgi:hypothetical protein
MNGWPRTTFSPFSKRRRFLWGSFLILCALFWLIPSPYVTAAVKETTAAGDIVVSEKKGLLSLSAADVEVARVLATLSKASNVPIEMLDPAGTAQRITLSFADKTIGAAVGEVMSKVPEGGYASVVTVNGAQQKIYVLTKEGARNFQQTTDALIDRLNRGETPPAHELRESLLNVAAAGFTIDPSGTSLFIAPIFHSLDRRYETYETVVLSLFRDPSAVTMLRAAMLELVDAHWDRPASRQELRAMFERGAADGALQGRVALALAYRGEKIGDALIERYPAASAEDKYCYAQALAALGRRDAARLLREDAVQMQNVPLRSAALTALIKLDAASTQTDRLVQDAIRAAKPMALLDRSATDFDNERIAMHAVEAIGRLAGAGSRGKLLSIAGDEAIAVDVRLTALESLAPSVATMAKADRAALSDQLAELERRVSESEQLNEMSKERMQGRIRMLNKLVAGEE